MSFARVSNIDHWSRVTINDNNNNSNNINSGNEPHAQQRLRCLPHASKHAVDLWLATRELRNAELCHITASQINIGTSSSDNAQGASTSAFVSKLHLVPSDALHNRTSPLDTKRLEALLKSLAIVNRLNDDAMIWNDSQQREVDEINNNSNNNHNSNYNPHPDNALRELYAKSQRAFRSRQQQSINNDDDECSPPNGASRFKRPLPDLRDRLGNMAMLPLSTVVGFLDARDLRRLRQASYYLHSCLRACVPGLRLRLFLHQERALTWMEAREASNATWTRTNTLMDQPLPTDELHSRWVVVGGETNSPVWVSRVDGSIRKESPPLEPMCRGGLLCDEPGLGKTITVLSLVLRSLGRTTEPRAASTGPIGDGSCGDVVSESDDDSVHMNERGDGSCEVVVNSLAAETAWAHMPVFAKRDVLKPLVKSIPELWAQAVMFLPLPLDPEIPVLSSHSQSQTQTQSPPQLQTGGNGFIGGAADSQQTQEDQLFQTPTGVVSYSTGSSHQRVTPALRKQIAIYGKKLSKPLGEYAEDVAKMEDVSFGRALSLLLAHSRTQVKGLKFLPSKLTQNNHTTSVHTAAGNVPCGEVGSSIIASDTAIGTTREAPANTSLNAQTTYASGSTSGRPSDTVKLLDLSVNNVCTVSGVMFLDQAQVVVQRLALPGRACIDRVRVAESQRRDDESLKHSGATLIVVPRPLLSHWRLQIQTYCDVSFCGEGPLAFLESATATTPTPTTAAASSSSSSANHTSTHTPSQGNYFVEGDALSQNAAELSKYKIVLISVNTLSRMGCEHSVRESGLRNVRWLRVVIDEGHSLGSGSITRYGSFLDELQAERRWAMTGTPSKETSLQAGVRSLLALFKYLKLDPFGGGGKQGNVKEDAAWIKSCLKSMAKGLADDVLIQVLSHVMIRHTKDETVELPKVIRMPPRCLMMSVPEETSYNAIVSTVRTNLVMTSIGHTGSDLSLLYASNTKLAHEAAKNIRLSCCGGGEMLATITNKNLIETRVLLVHKHNSNPDQVRRVFDFITCATRGELSECVLCGLRLLLLVVFPCGHLVCAECVREHCVVEEPRSKPTLRCPDCHAESSGDSIAALQPGMSLEWRDARASEDLAQHSKAQYIVKRVTELREIAKKRKENNAHYGDGNGSNSDKNGNGSDRYLGGSRSDNGYSGVRTMDWADTQHRRKRQQRLLHNRPGPVAVLQSDMNSKRDDGLGRVGRKRSHGGFKCIVFSQFRSVLNVLGHQLIMQFGQDSVSEFWGAYRDTELNKFVHDQVEYCSCDKCGFENDGVSKTCQQVFVTIRVISAHSDGPPNQRLQAEDNNADLPDEIVFPADYIVGYFNGRVLNRGELIDVKQKREGDRHGLIVRGTIKNIKRCNRALHPELRKQRRDVDCFVLLLSRDGAHGLDLSMVDHIFLLDQIFDEALEDQVISRAWRLGASSPNIIVEQLLMRNTAEHMLRDVYKQDAGDKIVYLLNHVRPVAHNQAPRRSERERIKLLGGEGMEEDEDGEDEGSMSINRKSCRESEGGKGKMKSKKRRRVVAWADMM